MIITVQGTNDKKNNATGVCASLASLTAMKKQKRTLVIQLMNKSADNVEMALIGKKIKSEEITMGVNISDMDKGIDPMLRSISTARADEELFTDSTTEIFQNHLLDILKSSNKSDFENEIVLKKSELVEILDGAKTVYDVIYILVPGKNKELGEMVSQMADYNVVCIPQGPHQGHIKANNNLYIATDYENTSMYTPQFLRKSYKIKKIYGMLHNSGYKDSFNSQALIQFFTRNLNNDKDDDNSVFISCLMELVDRMVISQESEVISDDLIEQKPVEEQATEVEEETVLTEIVEPEKIEEKKRRGLFGRKKDKSAPKESATPVVEDETAYDSTENEVAEDAVTESVEVDEKEEIPVEEVIEDNAPTKEELEQAALEERNNILNSFVSLLFTEKELDEFPTSYHVIFSKIILNEYLKKNQFVSNIQLLSVLKEYFLSSDFGKNADKNIYKRFKKSALSKDILIKAQMDMYIKFASFQKQQINYEFVTLLLKADKLMNKE